MEKLKNLHQLEAYEAYQLAFAQKGLPFPALMRLLGWSDSKGRRTLSRERYYPSYEEIPEICHKLGNSILVDWLQAKIAHAGYTAPSECMNVRNLPASITTLTADLGTVAATTQKALADKILTPEEKKYLRKQINVLLADGLQLSSKLHSLGGAAHG